MLTVMQIGDELAIPLPDEVLARMGVGVGDILHATVTPKGLLLTTSDPGTSHPSSPGLPEGQVVFDAQNRK